MNRIFIIILAWVCFAKHSSALVLNVFPENGRNADGESDQHLQEALENASNFVLASHLEVARPHPNVSAFNYWRHVGRVGMGSGIYLGSGYVLTSAHVGCYPFVMFDGSIYRPDYRSWRVLELEGDTKSDLAVFRVKIPEGDSGLAGLNNLPIASRCPMSDDPVLVMGTGLRQSETPAAMSSNGKILAVLGYHIDRQRATRGGFNHVHEVLPTPVKTGSRQTHCFTTRFDRNLFEAQACDGDSGGASFLYDGASGGWMLAGCIVAVSQRDGYIPFGSLTFLADLSRYREQIAEIVSGRDAVSRPELTVEPDSQLDPGGSEPQMVRILYPDPEPPEVESGAPM